MTHTPTRHGELEGVVTAKPCDCCGHHEIGIVTRAGDYFPLEPGMRVTVTDQAGVTTDDSASGNHG